MFSIISLFLYCIYITLNNTTNTPLIGILSLPCESEPNNCPNYINKPVSYIPASYVKWIESGGGRVIPILSDSTHQSVNTLLSKLNGVLFTGGGTAFNQTTSFWYSQANNILNYLRTYSQLTKNQNAIPLWATCLGFEALVCLTSENDNIRTSKSAEDISLTLNFESTAYKSRIFNSTMNEYYSNTVYNKLLTENLTYNHHGYGFDISIFNKNIYLKNNFTVLSQSNNNNIIFVSLIESKNNIGLYWYGSQFHPEKSQYIFDADNNGNHINHSLDGIYVNQYFSEFFVNECRLGNVNEMSIDEYNERVIYNYKSWFLNNGSGSYEQVYLFEASKE